MVYALKMLSNSSKYAVKAVLHLALHSSKEHKMMVKDISKSISVPQAYLAKLLQLLVKGNIVCSVRGVKGGYYLTQANYEKTLIDVIKATDGGVKLNSCVLNLEKCNSINPCFLHYFLSDSKDKIIKSLSDKSLSELVLDHKIILSNIKEKP